MPAENSAVSRNPEVVARLIEGETVLLNLDSGIYYSLEKTGSRIWELIDGSKTPADIAGVMAGEYEVEYSTALNDILELMNDLENEGLLKTP